MTNDEIDALILSGLNYAHLTRLKSIKHYFNLTKKQVLNSLDRLAQKELLVSFTDRCWPHEPMWRLAHDQDRQQNKGFKK